MVDKVVSFLNNRYFVAVIVLLFLLSVARSFRGRA